MKLGANGLDSIGIATPCEASWDAMKGNERVRFCGLCSMNVYNLTGMSRGEAEALVQKAEGRVCVRYYQRADGTVLTDDCPVGLRAIRFVRRKVGLAAASVAAFLGLGTLAGCPAGSSTTSVSPSTGGPVGPAPGGALPPGGRQMMGEACAPPPRPVAVVDSSVPAVAPAKPPAPPETTR